jgi:streptogramin lyase
MNRFMRLVTLVASVMVLMLSACRSEPGIRFSNIPLAGSSGCLCAIAADRAGDVWVANQGRDTGAVYKLNQSGQVLATYDKASVGVSPVGTRGTLRRPFGLSIDSAGNLWVLEEDSVAAKISASGRMIGSFTTGGHGAGSMELDRDDNLWIENQSDLLGGTGSIGELDPNGRLVKYIYNDNTPKALFKGPAALAIDAQGNVWIANSGGDSVTELNSEGAAIAHYDNRNVPGAEFIRPYGIAIDRDGGILILNVDSVSKLSPAGKLLGHFTVDRTSGGMTIDQNSHMWLADEKGVSEFLSSGQLASRYDGGSSPSAGFAAPMSLAIASGTVWLGNVHDPEIASLVAVTGSNAGAQFFPYGGLENQTGPQWPKSR